MVSSGNRVGGLTFNVAAFEPRLAAEVDQATTVGAIQLLETNFHAISRRVRVRMALGRKFPEVLRDASGQNSVSWYRSHCTGSGPCTQEHHGHDVIDEKVLGWGPSDPTLQRRTLARECLCSQAGSFCNPSELARGTFFFIFFADKLCHSSLWGSVFEDSDKAKLFRETSDPVLETRFFSECPGFLGPLWALWWRFQDPRFAFFSTLGELWRL